MTAENICSCNNPKIRKGVMGNKYCEECGQWAFDGIGRFSNVTFSDNGVARYEDTWNKKRMSEIDAYTPKKK